MQTSPMTLTIPLEWKDAPPVLMLRERVGYDARLHVLDLWAWQARNLPGPHPAGVLEAAAGWRGPVGKLVEALHAAGFLKGETQGVWAVTPWREVFGNIPLAVEIAAVAEKQRAAVRERVRRYRERQKQAGEANLAADALDGVTPSVTSVTGNVTESVTSVTCNAPLSSSEVLSSSKITEDTENVTDVEQAVTAGNDDPLALLFDEPFRPKPRTASQVDQVWAVYAETVPRVRLTKQREELIKRRLKEYSVDDLCRSIRGYGKSRWHAGENERGTKYQTLELWLRDAAHVEAGWRYAEQDGKQASMRQRGLSGIEEAWDAYAKSQ